MAYAERHKITVTTNAAGAGTGYTPIVSGKIRQIVYDKTDFDNGVDFDVTLEATGEVVWDQDNVNADAVVAPRIATHTTLGVAALYAAAGQPVLDCIVAAHDRVKIAVTNGGNVKSGVFYVIVGD